MFVAHLPAGYVLCRLLPRPVAETHGRLILLGAVLPDLDLLWFFLVDDQAIHHHGYLTHRPALWLCLLAVGWIMPRWGSLSALALGGLVHMLLDSVTGSVDWGWPLATFEAPLVGVPPTHAFWVWSFLCHWTFALECLICALAFGVWLRGRRESR